MKYYTIRVKDKDGVFWKKHDIKRGLSLFRHLDYYTEKYGKENVILMEK